MLEAGSAQIASAWFPGAIAIAVVVILVVIVWFSRGGSRGRRR